MLNFLTIAFSEWADVAWSLAVFLMITDLRIPKAENQKYIDGTFISEIVHRNSVNTIQDAVDKVQFCSKQTTV